MATKDERITEAKKATGGIADLFDEEGNYDPFLQILLQNLENRFKDTGNLDASIEQINAEEGTPYFVTRPIDRVFSTKNENTELLTYMGPAIVTNKTVVVLSGKSSIDTYFIETAFKLEALKSWDGRIVPNAFLANEKFVNEALLAYGINLLPVNQPVIFVDEKGGAKIRTNEYKPRKISYTRETPFAFAVCF